MAAASAVGPGSAYARNLDVTAKVAADSQGAHFRPGSSLIYGAFLGGFSGCVAKTMVAPLSRIVIQMQLFPLHGSEVSGVIRTAQSIYMEGGLRAFWRGNGATLGHRCVTNAINFPVNELAKKWLSGRPKQERNFMAALAGSAAGTMVGHPLDVIKTKLAASKRFGYEGLWQSHVKIWKEEGLRGFYAGFRISCGTIIPTVTCCFYLKDFFRDASLTNWLCARSGGWLPADALAGAAGGCGAAVLFFPLDVWKRQVQMVGGNQMLRVAMRQNCQMQAAAVGIGVRLSLVAHALSRHYHGLPAELVKVSVNTGIMFGLYDKMSRLATPQ